MPVYDLPLPVDNYGVRNGVNIIAQLMGQGDAVIAAQ
jgi:hypothetical protein